MAQYIDHKDCGNLEELLNAVDALQQNSDDHHSSTVYLTQSIRFTLVEETLSDGSTVKNINITFID